MRTATATYNKDSLTELNEAITNFLLNRKLVSVLIYPNGETFSATIVYMV